MPKTKFQGVIFGIIMSYTMAFGMEVYNIAVEMGFAGQSGGLSNMTNEVFGEAFIEAVFMGVLVFIVSNLFGNRFGFRFAEKYTDAKKDNPYFCRLMRQAGTIAVMCPAMSFAASVLFNVILGDSSLLQLPAIFIGTVMKNFPMAFFFNMFAAAPFTYWLFGLLFREKKSSLAFQED